MPWLCGDGLSIISDPLYCGQPELITLAPLCFSLLVAQGEEQQKILRTAKRLHRVEEESGIFFRSGLQNAMA